MIDADTPASALLIAATRSSNVELPAEIVMLVVDSLEPPGSIVMEKVPVPTDEVSVSAIPSKISIWALASDAIF